MVLVKILPRSHLEKAQGLVEYALILALVAIAAIVVLGAFGETVRDSYYCIFGAMTGSSRGSGGGFTLIDPNSDKDVQSIACGSTISKSEIALTQFNMRANVADPSIDSVVLVTEGAINNTTIHNEPPYATWSESGGDYQGKPLTTGRYIVKATAYDGPNGTGNVVYQLVVFFNVVD